MKTVAVAAAVAAAAVVAMAAAVAAVTEAVTAAAKVTDRQFKSENALRLQIAVKGVFLLADRSIAGGRCGSHGGDHGGDHWGGISKTDWTLASVPLMASAARRVSR